MSGTYEHVTAPRCARCIGSRERQARLISMDALHNG